MEVYLTQEYLMLREVIKPETGEYILHLPDEYVNREIEILVVPTDEIHSSKIDSVIIKKSAGILKGKISDPVQWQRNIRSEWDKR